MQFNKEFTIICLCLLAFSYFSCVPSYRSLPHSLDEISGVFGTSPDDFFSINDGGNKPYVYVTDSLSNQFNVFSAQGNNTDREAMTALTKGEICVCDIGDNRKHRKTIYFEYFSKSGQLTSTKHYRYPKNPQNAEACFSWKDNIYVLTKASVWDRGGRYAYLYLAPKNQKKLILQDSILLHNRSVTDAVVVNNQTLTVLAYDFKMVGFWPRCRTSLFKFDLKEEKGKLNMKFVDKRHLRLPFAVSQYESILHAKNDVYYIFSERTKWIPARWRKVNY